MKNMQVFAKAVTLLGASFVAAGSAQAWQPTVADAQNGSVALAKYLNDNPTFVARLANIGICFNNSSSRDDCKDASKGIDPAVFSAQLVSFDPVVPSLKIHLTASRIFIFGSPNNKYEGDISVTKGYSINGCSYTVTGTPEFTFENEGGSTLNNTYINAFHSQLTDQSSNVMNALLGGYQGLPGFMHTCATSSN